LKKVINKIKKINFLLGSDNRGKIVKLLWKISTMAFLDLVGVVLILPFIKVLTNPEIIETNFYLNYFNSQFC